MTTPYNANLKPVDLLSKAERSLQMRKVRSRGNRSTELALKMAFVRAGLEGWKLHPRDLLGVPDFWFAKQRVAIFVDGCFWHGCSNCLRIPKRNRTYWESKIAQNVFRGKEVNGALARIGIKVVRVWEHELRATVTLAKAIARIERALKLDNKS